MRRLLSANFLRLRKNKGFWLWMALLLLAGMFVPFSDYLNALKWESHISFENDFFTIAAFIGVVSSVFCGLFLGTEYSDGTIRNKMIIGHKRSCIYLANLITCIAAALFMCMAWFLAYIGMGVPLLGFFERTEASGVAWNFLTLAFLTMAYTAIFTMISMLLQNKAIASVVCILSAFVLLMVGTMIRAKLEEPEFYSDYVFTENGEPVQTEEEPNPYYVSGTKREVYQFFNDFLPGGQMIQCAAIEADNPLLAVYSAIIMLGTTGIGMYFFQRENIK